MSSGVTRSHCRLPVVRAALCLPAAVATAWRLRLPQRRWCERRPRVCEAALRCSGPWGPDGEPRAGTPRAGCPGPSFFRVVACAGTPLSPPLHTFTQTHMERRIFLDRIVGVMFLDLALEVVLPFICFRRLSSAFPYAFCDPTWSPGAPFLPTPAPPHPVHACHSLCDLQQVTQLLHLSLFSCNLGAKTALTPVAHPED